MSLKSIVEIEINKPREKVAELFADPVNNPKWMHDLARYEPVSGERGLPGSTYRLVPKEGDRIFVATVIERNLPDEFRLNLEGATVDVAIRGTFIPLSPTRTKLISEESFTFKGSYGTAMDSGVEDAIRAAHRQHIEDFKSFAEHLADHRAEENN